MSKKQMILLVLLHIVICQSVAYSSQITIWTSETLPGGYIDVIKRDPQMSGIQVGFLNATTEEIQKLMLQGRGPDIFLIQPSQILNMANEKSLLSVKDIVLKNSTLSNYMKYVIPATKDLVTINGSLYGIPQTMLIQGMCYNPTPIKDAGLWLTPKWTWDDFRQVAAKLNQLRKPMELSYYHIKTYGLEWTTTTTVGVSISSRPTTWAPFLWSNGGSIGKIDSPQSREALSFLAQLGTADLVVPLFASQTMELALGKVYMAPGYSDYIYTVPYILSEKQRNTAPYPAKEIKILPYPYSPTGNTSGYIWRIRAYAVSAFTKKVDEASRFLAASLSKQAQQAAARQGWISVRSDVLLPAELQTVKPLVDSLTTQSDSSGIRDSIYRVVELGFYQLLRGEVTLDAFIEQVQQAL